MRASHGQIRSLRNSQCKGPVAVRKLADWGNRKGKCDWKGEWKKRHSNSVVARWSSVEVQMIN